MKRVYRSRIININYSLYIIYTIWSNTKTSNKIYVNLSWLLDLLLRLLPRLSLCSRDLDLFLWPLSRDLERRWPLSRDLDLLWPLSRDLDLRWPLSRDLERLWPLSLDCDLLLLLGDLHLSFDLLKQFVSTLHEKLNYI